MFSSFYRMTPLKSHLRVWPILVGFGLWVGCASGGSSGSAKLRDEGNEEATLTVSEIGLPYGAFVRVSRAEWEKPMQGYFHDYRDGKLILNVGEAVYDTGVVVEIIDRYHPEVALCDTLERDGRWSIINEGQWVSLYGRNGRALARGRAALILPDSIYVAKSRIVRDSVCRVEVAWPKTGERHQGWTAIPVTVGKTMVKVIGVIPVTFYSLIVGNSQALQRLVNW